MKRQKSTHDPVFSNSEFAARYAKKHMKMARRFGIELTQKLREKNFHKGRILDAGCGFGETLISLAKNFPHTECTGIDLSEPLLELARKNAGLANLWDEVKFIEADVRQIPFPDDYFDVVLNINMAHLVDKPEKMLNELERVRAKNGYFFIVDIRRSWIGFWEREFKSAFSAAEAKSLIGTTDLQNGEMMSDLLWWRYES
jgi:ubiquinone/menaquinone biosynthesis C-methylase UbiE